MILSKNDIETLAIGVMQDFNSFFWNSENGPYSSPQFTPIDQFAVDYLGLDVTFEHLSADGSICGLTAYADTEYLLSDGSIERRIPLRQNQVILEEKFIEPRHIKQLCGRRRFTLAHECAHQILFQLESDESKTACRKMYAERSSYSPHELKTREDWNEWQANALGAAIMMPMKEVETFMKSFHIRRKLKCFDGHSGGIDERIPEIMCEFFGVSKSAMKIRLINLGYAERLVTPHLCDYQEMKICAE